MTPRLTLKRRCRLPDPLRIARCRRAPELGPRILFFSGGTALRGLSRRLKLATHNSVHLITPFDSGGSSAKLRRAFGMLSVGDLRNRLIALADETTRGNPEIYRLFSHRLPAESEAASLRATLGELVAGRHPRIAAVPTPLRRLVRTALRGVADRLPADFDLRGASIGNLALAGGILDNDGDISSALFLFSRLLAVRGTVRPVVHADLHLAATLADGTRLIGQHAITGKETAPPESRIERLELVRSLTDPTPTRVAISADIRGLILDADLIVFSYGSFFTSLLASLLPDGVAEAIRESGAPRVFLPPAGRDPELVGQSLASTVARLLAVLDPTGESAPESRLDAVLLAEQDADYALELDASAITARGIPVLRLPLRSASEPPLLDPEKVLAVLLSLA